MSSTARPAASAPAAAPAKKTCTVDTEPPEPAETAYNNKDYKAAEALFRAMLPTTPDYEGAHEGLIRAMLEQDRVADAAKDAEAWSATAPSGSMALTALAEVRLRQGIPMEAFTLLRKALGADLCNARAYYAIADVRGLAGYHANARALIEQAYALHPTDDDIHTAWMSTRSRRQRMAMWAEYAEHSDQINADDRAELKTRLEKDSLSHTSDCRMAAGSPRTATIPMARIQDGPRGTINWGLDVGFNGKRRRLEIDTGASGITLSRGAALFLGLLREDATEIGGIGDKAKVHTAIAHVASIKIGGVEFTNCPVEILEKWNVLNSDGLIGTDVFDSSLVTLDFPKQTLRIAPLPLGPGEKPADRDKPESAGDDQDYLPHDPYIAPGMENWLRIYRSGHDLLIPTGLVATKRAKDPSAWRTKLFLLDTGSDSNLISPAAAREVTKVSRDDSIGIRGLQGEVNKVYDTDSFTLVFANLRLDPPDMTAIDMTSISHGAGVEVSGLIGAPALFQIVMHIDYRDNLVLLEYTPPK